ncbi:competence type IV pilus major pilin ComGC [Falsibacillus albus]|uniref:ComG operon protein 3 n=1 Tax=Falsibacillus albus TaxID=2478915 RepID=A0A3L7K6N3_9BACI|nr:competence type IV pilus major pilin ComGC [Falsibacillus albus]RLQ98245.1 prepilin-type N-terminal cleavage/methylation domain-containing protein [Falsibacillus albus]
MNEKGFTLIEMMIVLLVISVLLFITIPNVTKHTASINQKGCKAFVHMVQGQVEAYQMEKGTLPASVADLNTEGYLRDGETQCPNGDAITIDADGTVTSTSTSP